MYGYYLHMLCFLVCCFFVFASFLANKKMHIQCSSMTVFIQYNLIGAIVHTNSLRFTNHEKHLLFCLVVDDKLCFYHHVIALKDREDRIKKATTQ